MQPAGAFDVVWLAGSVFFCGIRSGDLGWHCCSSKMLAQQQRF